MQAFDRVSRNRVILLNNINYKMRGGLAGLRAKEAMAKKKKEEG